MKKYIQKVQIWRINKKDFDECSGKRHHEEKPTGQRNKTRGFQNGRKVVLAKPPPDASQSRKDNVLAVDRRIRFQIVQIQKIVKPETIKHHPKRSSMLPLSQGTTSHKGL